MAVSVIFSLVSVASVYQVAMSDGRTELDFLDFLATIDVSEAPAEKHLSLFFGLLLFHEPQC